MELFLITRVHSDLTEKELIDAPENVRSYFQQLNNNNVERIEVTLDAYKLAQANIDANVVGQQALTIASILQQQRLIRWIF